MIWIFVIITHAIGLKFSPLLGPEEGGTIVTAQDFDFIPTSSLTCIFGSLDSTSVTYINITSILCESPPNSGNTNFAVTTDGISYTTASDQFIYYPTPIISTISPSSGSEIESHSITIELQTTITNTDLLFCKLGNYISTGTYIDSGTMTCEIAPYPDLLVLDSGISNPVPIYISRNGQQYTDTGFSFNYLSSYWDYLQNFTVSQYHGPVSGNTEVVIFLYKEISSYTPMCKFGDTLSTPYNVFSANFSCLSPKYSQNVKVKLSISLNAIDFGSFGREFVYDYNITFNSISPNQGTLLGGTDVYIKGTGFKPYDTLFCMFDSTKISATYISQWTIKCVSPSHTSGQVPVKFTLNGQDYYDVGNYIYRASETINNISPAIGPLGGGTNVLVNTSLYDSSTAFCRFGSSYKVKVTINSNSYYCLTPPYSVLNTNSFKLYISSNDFDYESYATFTYYTEITLSFVSPRFITDESKSRVFTVLGTGFTNTGLITALINGNIYNANYINSTAASFTLSNGLTSTGKNIVKISLNSQNYSPSTSYIEVFTTPVISSVTPSFGFLTGGITLTIFGTNFVYSEKIYCQYDTTKTAGQYVSTTSVICTNPSKSSAVSSYLSVSFNNMIDFSNQLIFKYIQTPTFTSISPSQAYNRQTPQANISYSSVETPVVVKVGQISITNFISANTQNIVFNIPAHPSGTYSIEISFNYLEKVTPLSFTFLGECKIGYLCPITSLYSMSPCPPGTYCPSADLTVPIPCGPGTYSNKAAATSCSNCDSGYYCPSTSLSSPVTCPGGYLCQSSGLSMLSSLTNCPAGYACSKNKSSACVTGTWCGPRTYSPSNIVIFDFRAPQNCRSGYQCNSGSSLTPYGSGECPSGSYCIYGSTYDCPTGHYCPNTGLDVPEGCLPGFYNPNVKLTECLPCDIGKICQNSTSVVQTTCPAGNVCSIRGRPNPNSVCPAGSYCLVGTNNLVSGTTNGPILCPGGSFCLEGIQSGTILDGDATHPQTCIEGTYCPIGTKNPVEYPCPEGYYCPQGSVTPVPTKEGEYSQHTGNTIPTKCSPGRYSNTTSAVSCSVCPAGYYCASEGTITPTICAAGTYREADPNSIYCELCPQGTWSGTEGLKAESQCSICPAGIVCLQQGMTSLSQASVCPEGYICKEGTTSYSLQNSKCPAGYYCGTGTSVVADYEICDPGYYCPEGTPSGSSHQHECLAGYYCPAGTNATLNEKGEYEYISQVNYTSIIEFKEAANEECCGNTTCKSTTVSSCKIYTIPEFGECEENKLLPSEILSSYTSQLCPEGTTSSIGAECVGQCQSIGATYVVKAINPLNSFTNLTSRMLDDIPVYYISPMKLLLLYFDLKNVDSRFKYNSHFSIALKDSSGSLLTMPSYFSDSSADFHKNFTISIMNYSPTIKSVSVSMSLHNALFNPIISQLENTVDITECEPSRAILGSDSSFGAIIYVNDFSSVTLPYNLIEVTETGAERAPLIDVSNDEEWNGTYPISTPPFDSTFWTNYDIQTFVMPWLPFFMNCEYFGNKIYLFRLLELMDGCKLVPKNKTVIVQSIPTTGFYPTADSCNLNFKCYYSEDLTSNSPFWFSLSQDTVLFYLTSDPQSTGSYFATGENGYDSTFTNDILITSDNIVPVTFRPSSSNGIPTTVVLEINYFQKDSSTKNIISASVSLEDYSLDLSSSKHPSYTLKVKYSALGWFALFNNFRLGLSVFTFVFVIIGVALIILVLAVYWCHWRILRYKNPPKLHFLIYFPVVTVPPALGTLYGNAPMALVTYILYLLYDANVLSTVVANWSNIGQAISKSDQDNNNRGRLGTALIFAGFAFVYYGAYLLIPSPKERPEAPENSSTGVSSVDEHKSHKHKADSEDFTKVDRSGHSTDNSDITNLEEKEEIEEDDETIEESPLYKRLYFFIISIVASLIITYKLEISYSDRFTSSIFGYLFLFMVIDIILNQVLFRLIVNEMLLAAPFLASLSSNIIICTMAAANFTSYMECYAFTTGMMVFERLYLYPFMEYIEQKVQEYTILLMTKYKWAEKLFRNIIIKQLKMESNLLTSVNKSAPISGTNTEGLLGTMVKYSAQIQAIIMAPFILLVIIFFPEATQIPKGYSIPSTDVRYYFLFTSIIIIPHLIADLFLFHLLEIMYDYKIFDYLTYSWYRFRTRKDWWKHIYGIKLDRSLLINWRSIDNMCYSSQYYFSITIASWGIIFMSFGITIYLRNGFNPFNDPILWLFFIIQLIILKYSAIFLAKITKFIQLWRPMGHKIFTEDIPQDDEEAIVNLIDDYMEENALVHKIQSGIFKSKFLRKNKEWLIARLPDIVEDNYQCQQYLMDKYKELFDYHEAEELKRKAIEDRIDQMQALPHNRPKRYRDDISEKSDPPKTPPHEPDFENSTARIALCWVDKARFMIMIKAALEDPYLLESHCDSCGSNQQLKLVPLISFYEIYNEYKEAFKGLPLKTNHWKEYYIKNQEFKTLCFNCAYIWQLKMKKDIRVMTPLAKMVSEELALLNKAKKDKESKSVVKKIAFKWLMEARSRLGKSVRSTKIMKVDEEVSMSVISVSSKSFSIDVSEVEEP